MDFNQVWTLVDPPKDIKPVGCEWVYKRKLGAEGEVTASKARIVAKCIVEEEIYMDQFEGFTSIGEEQKGYDFMKNEFDPCIYKKISGSSVAYLVLYVDDILLIENDVKISTGIDPRACCGLTQSSYIDKVLKRFKIENSKRGFRLMRHRIKLSNKQFLKTNEELKQMSDIHYASVFSMLFSALGLMSDVFLIYGGGEFKLEDYSDASFQSDDDDAKSQLNFVFKLNGGVIT
ncbi:UNVERIFIED_CONTAM: hypothetical protein Sindi_1650900 [Sesamum indicum]